MRRRDLFTFIGGVASWPMVVLAQRRDVTTVIGILMGFGESDANAQGLVTAFRSAFAKLGWREGGQVRIEVRWGAGDPDKIRKFAQELVDLRPDVILAQTTPVLRALAMATQTIPIVFAVVSDPIGGGFAQSLTHPGGKITGFTDVEPAMGGKWV